uniref:Transposable element protein, putative n=2 Tax=Oryza sativa subsp. japonica TaxID=39947 RepID=Q53L64_ORYSJ|nr:Transposable element protein, putative [Oryza sativa Japonica Group]AAX96877.1 Transposable element protein, putative [Oryza sativa Japonica Group]ABA92517.1 Zinc knuckle family protein [Oryza sativa Japonica Group]
MASKTLREFAAPSADNVAVGPQVNIGDVDFDLKSSLITMAQASPFCGKPNEDANAHLQHFLEICILPDGQNQRPSWTNFQFPATRDESIPEAWERLQEYVAACPHHGMDDWLIPQNFYNGLTPMSRDHLDAAAGGAFFSKTVQGAIELIEKMVSNMGWSEERQQTRQRGMHIVKETELLAAKLDLLMKCLDDHEKRPQGTIKALDSHVTCEVCGGMGHSRNDCPETREQAMYMGNNNGYRPQGGQGWNQPRPYYQGGNNNGNFSNQPSLKDLVFAQAKTTDALCKKLAANDKILENINVKLDGLASAFQNWLSFNKMIETQLAQLASLVPANESERIPGQPDSSIENVKAITTRGDKSTRDPPYHNPAGTNGMSKETPSRRFSQRRPCLIQKIHINVPLLDAMQVPTYARYLKDILNNKRLLPTTEVVKLTEHCSNLILHKLLEKKKDPRCPTITCSIGAQQFNQALCDLGASVSVMPKDVFDKLNFTVLAPTPMRLQLADSSVRYPAGIAEDVPVKIRDFFIPVDFVVLDMDTAKETLPILGRPFLSTAGANIDVVTGSIHFHINGMEEKFEFQPRTEQCSMVRIKYGPNP